MIYLALIFLWVISVDLADTWERGVRPLDSLRQLRNRKKDE